jgi:hypothetical protein
LLNEFLLGFITLENTLNMKPVSTPVLRSGAASQPISSTKPPAKPSVTRLRDGSPDLSSSVVAEADIEKLWGECQRMKLFQHKPDREGKAQPNGLPPMDTFHFTLFKVLEVLAPALCKDKYKIAYKTVFHDNEKKPV